MFAKPINLSEMSEQTYLPLNHIHEPLKSLSRAP